MSKHAVDERSFRWVGWLVTTVLVMLAARSGLNWIHANDSFWHLATFRDWWENGSSPFVDHFTYTHDGESISAQPILFQGVLYGLVQWLGLVGGFLSYKAGSFVLITGAWVASARRLDLSWLAIAMGGLLLIAALHGRALVRPELLVFPIAIWLAGWSVRYRDELPRSGVIEAALLVLVATVVHQTSVLCYAIVGVSLASLFLKAWFRADRSTLAHCVIAGLVIAGVSFLNPFGPNPVLTTLRMTGHGYEGLIQEYVSPGMQHTMVPTVTLMLAAAATRAWWRGRYLTPVLLVAIFAYQAYSTLRAGPFLVLAVLPWVMLGIQQAIDGMAAESRRVVWSLGVFVAAAVFVLSPMNHLGRPVPDRLPASRYPVGLASSLGTAEGNVIARFDLGGYLAHAHPSLKTYVDGRSAILFTPDFLAQANAGLVDEQAFAAMIDQPAPADWVVVNTRDVPFLSVVAVHGDWVIEDSDQFFVLFRRGQGRYPLATRLLATPECVSAADRSAIEAELTAWREREGALDEEVQRIRGMPLVASLLVSGYRGLSEEPMDFEPHVSIHRAAARSLARMALARNDIAAVWERLAGVPVMEQVAIDSLLGALTRLRSGDSDGARIQAGTSIRHMVSPRRVELVRAAVGPDADEAQLESALTSLLHWRKLCR